MNIEEYKLYNMDIDIIPTVKSFIDENGGGYTDTVIPTTINVSGSILELINIFKSLLDMNIRGTVGDIKCYYIGTISEILDKLIERNRKLQLKDILN